MKTRVLRCLAPFAIVALVAFQLAVDARPAAAAAGAVIADVVLPLGDDGTLWPVGISPSVAFDGKYLYYAEYSGPVLHRIDVPPPGAPTEAANKVDMPIVGMHAGVMSLAYDRGRDMFWAIGGDGLSVYLLSKTGVGTLMFTINATIDRPGYEATTFATETKLAYDRSDDTIWYSPDANARIFHYQTYADILGTAQLVAATPYVDVSVSPNDMVPQCGYSIVSGVAVGGDHLFLDVAGCPYYFEYSKTGTKIGWFPLIGTAAGDIECDNLSYSVSVLWVKDAFSGRIRAYEQPAAGACTFGGGNAP
jgi:hypothetical protein